MKQIKLSNQTLPAPMNLNYILRMCQMSHKRKSMKSLPVRENTFSTREMVRENFEMDSVEVAALRAE